LKTNFLFSHHQLKKHLTVLYDLPLANPPDTDLDCEKQSYDVALDGALVKQNIEFAEKADSLERLHFRTGPWRSDVRMFIIDGEPGNPGLYQEDLPGADHKVAGSVFLIDDVRTGS